MTAREIYEQSNGDVTKAYYNRLNDFGVPGRLAMNLMRAHKNSHRAKQYRGNSIGKAYDTKEWAISQLVSVLISHGEKLGIRYRWKEDTRTIMAGRRGGWIIYIDLPTGQVSFHTPTRGLGPAYSGEWDGKPLSDVRIIRYCDNVTGDKPEDLKQLLDLERIKPIHGNPRNLAHRQAIQAARERRIGAIREEFARLSGEEVRHIERQAEMVQLEMFG